MTDTLPTDLKTCHALIKELRNEAKLWREYADQGAGRDEILWVGALNAKLVPLWDAPNIRSRTGCRALVALAMYPGRVCSKSVFHDYLVTLTSQSRTVKGESPPLSVVAIWAARKAATGFGFEKSDITAHWGQGYSISDRLREFVKGFKP